LRKSFPKMNKRRRKTIAGIMAIVLLACVYPSFPVYADKVSELEQKLKEEKEKKKDTENRIGESQNELDSLRNTTNGLKESSVTSTIIWRK
jgi:septal ring factor EnvC (AmiA/AmiB activator)